MRPLIAIDWGTSALRGARLGPTGQVLDSRAFARGILSVPAGQFAAVLDELFGDWLQAPELLRSTEGYNYFYPIVAEAVNSGDEVELEIVDEKKR